MPQPAPNPAALAGLRRKRWRSLLRCASSALGGAVVAFVGWVLVHASLGAGEHAPRDEAGGRWLLIATGEKLARLSYDLLFVMSGRVQTPDACIVYLDEGSAAALGQSEGIWDRRLHAQLLRRLTGEGARAVFFDIVFADPSTDPATDRKFAEAMKENGHVFVGAALEIDAGHGAHQERTIPPTPELRRAAAGWGLLTFRPVDADYSVRRIYAGTEDVPSATWRAAVKLGAPLVDTIDARQEPRWLRYFGPAGSFPNVSYDRALAPDGVPAGFFRNRLVFVGGRSTLDAAMLGKDDFGNPYGLLGGEFSKGVEIHLTTLLNLLRGDWLRRLPAPLELWLVCVAGVLLGAGLPLLRPHLATLAAFVTVCACAGLAVWLFSQHRIWFAWSVPALVQPPLALAWALGSRYFLEERRRMALRRAFAHYLSPHMADRVAEADFDLAPGGVMMEATIMFTDLEGFTSLSEKLNNPQQVARVLTTYFSRTTAHILGNDGTIIKFLGDAVEAVWGAPVADVDHARKAVLAAWRLHQDSGAECEGQSLRTRIGLSTGDVLSGNLGSAQRFDYAVIGDAVNLAARLEGLNKQLGTAILLSEAVRARLGGGFRTRCLGEFVMAGKKEISVVHEMLGPETETAPQIWMESFAIGLAAFRTGDFAGSEAAFRQTLHERGGADGPSTFYLALIARLQQSPSASPWTGVIELSSK